MVSVLRMRISQRILQSSRCIRGRLFQAVAVHEREERGKKVRQVPHRDASLNQIVSNSVGTASGGKLAKKRLSVALHPKHIRLDRLQAKRTGS